MNRGSCIVRRRTFPAVLVALLSLLGACRSVTLPAPQSPARLPAPVAATSPPAASAALVRDDRLGALLWFQTAAEYRILALSTYSQASAALDRALADPTWTAAVEQGEAFSTLPPAVIVDVDETVLDNSPLEARLVLAGRRYNPVDWKEWIETAEAEPIPGALEFARKAAARGVTLFYVTNRAAADEAKTRQNLIAKGFPVRSDIDAVLTQGERPEFVADKASRRAEVAKAFRVLLLVGDDLNDFITGARALPEERVAVAERHAAMWGARWFLLPNPDYGSWEKALYGNERGLSEEEILRRKLARLRLPK